MSEEERKQLEKDVRKLKRVAQEWASQLHDLVEDRLPAGYRDLPAITQSTFDACQAWDEASRRLAAAEAGAS